MDVSGGGSAWTVCRFRRGFDARSLAPVRLTGEQTNRDDRAHLIAKLAAVLDDRSPERQVSAMFVDSAFGAVVVERLRRMGYNHVFEVNFGAPSVDEHDANTRATMWRKMKEWLIHGAIRADDVRLATDVTAPGAHLNRKNQLVIESKESMVKRGAASPDDGDALALTWALPVRVGQRAARWLQQSAAWTG